jgi:hypothetical protein
MRLRCVVPVTASVVGCDAAWVEDALSAGDGEGAGFDLEL